MIRCMANIGRPSKGTRDLMVTRLPLSDGQAVRGISEARSWNLNDTLAALVAIGLAHADELPPAPIQTGEQQRLPLADTEQKEQSLRAS